MGNIDWAYLHGQPVHQGKIRQVNEDFQVEEVLGWLAARSFFIHDGSDDRARDRIQTRNIHITGPLIGSGPIPVQGEVAEFENQVFQGTPVLVEGLSRLGLKQQRRSLRLFVRQFVWSFDMDGSLVLQFSLAKRWLWNLCGSRIG